MERVRVAASTAEETHFTLAAEGVVVRDVHGPHVVLGLLAKEDGFERVVEDVPEPELAGMKEMTGIDVAGVGDAQAAAAGMAAAIALAWDIRMDRPPMLGELIELVVADRILIERYSSSH